MSNEIKIFESNEFGQVRSIYINGKPYFAGIDIATVLGYKDTAKAIRTHCKGVTDVDTPTKGGIQKLKFISEGDLYRLIIKSQMQEANEFESWIMDEVLPEIRKTGQYKINKKQTVSETLRENARLSLLAADYYDKLENLADNYNRVVKNVNSLVDNMQSKVIGNVTVWNIDGIPWFKVRDIANELDISYVRSMLRRVDEIDIKENSNEENKDRVYVNAKGFYKIILTSRSDTAKDFREILSSKVLPSLNEKEDEYNVDNKLEEL